MMGGVLDGGLKVDIKKEIVGSWIDFDQK